MSSVTLGIGCSGSKDTLRRSNVDAIFQTTPEAARRAFRIALDDLGVVEGSSHDPTELVGRFDDGTSHGTISVKIGEDTLGVLARVEGRADEGPIPDLAFQIVGRASAMLDQGEPLFRPQNLFPNDSTNCRAPTYSGDDVVPPALVGNIDELLGRAGYTRAARDAGIEGRVLVAFVVDERGRVPCAMVILGLRGGLNREAINAILSSDFESGTVGGVPTPMRAVLPFTFRKPTST